MLRRLKPAIIVLLVLAWPEPGISQPGPACVQSGIAAGGDHTCAFTGPDGTAMCWGDNSFGQNGNGTFATPTPVPTVVSPSFAPTSILPNQPHQLIAGQRHTCAILVPEPTAVCWGDDTSGQLGDGRNGTGVFGPSEVPVVDPNNSRPLNTVFAVAAGDLHSCALICPPNPPPNQPRCRVQCWGDNGFGQLGIGSTGGLSAFPAASVVFPPSCQGCLPTTPIDIGAGASHTCAVMGDNTARCWGDNSFGQIGNCAAPRSTVNSPVIVNFGRCPTTTAPLLAIVQIAAGSTHSCALLRGGPDNATGNVACWGTGPEGELGNPGTTSSPNPVPVVDSSGAPDSRLNGVTEIAAGSHHTCALMNTPMNVGTVQCWGSNAKGQLGPGARGNCPAPNGGVVSCSEFPVTVTDASGNPLSGVAHIAAGHNHTCATISAGGVQCWGDNFFDQLGASTAPNTMSATPVAVGGLCTCPGPIMSCNGQCIDTSSDTQNCGGCGNLCTGGICMASVCKCPTSPVNLTLCPPSGSSHVCVDTSSNSNNCGQCGHACPAGETCSNSVCGCAPGLTSCDGGCVDLQTDNNNCGGCGLHCRRHPPCNRVESGCTSCENGECVPD